MKQFITSKRLFVFGLLFAVILSVPITLKLVKDQQDIRQQAATQVSTSVPYSPVFCAKGPLYPEDSCAGYRLVATSVMGLTCYDSQTTCEENITTGSCVRSTASETNTCDGYIHAPGIGKTCYQNATECEAQFPLITIIPQPTGK